LLSAFPEWGRRLGFRWNRLAFTPGSFSAYPQKIVMLRRGNDNEQGQASLGLG
jgi:hypothetical protein